MAIVIEDGTGVAGANSYATEAELTTYASDRGITVAGTAAQLLLVAMTYIESRSFKGNKNTAAQVLVWPRNSVWVDGFELDSDSIPQLLIDGQIEAALAHDAGNGPTNSIGRATKKEKLGDLEVEYMDSAAQAVINMSVNMKLGKLLLPGNKLVRT